MFLNKPRQNIPITSPDMIKDVTTFLHKQYLRENF